MNAALKAIIFCLTEMDCYMFIIKYKCGKRQYLITRSKKLNWREN